MMQCLLNDVGYSEPVGDIILNKHDFSMNHAGSTSLLVAYRYELYEAQVLSNGIYVPKSYWRHILSINVLSCIMFNSYGLITAIKEQYNKEDHINSLQRLYSLQ